MKTLYLDLGAEEGTGVFLEPMTLNQYQEGALETAVYPGRGNMIGLLYTSLGLAGEAGEHAEKAKKMLREDVRSLVLCLVATLKSVPTDRLQRILEDQSILCIADLCSALENIKLGPVPIDAVRRDQAKKELGDVLWYVAMCAQEWGITLEEVAETNLAKLADRKERGVMHGNGDDR